MEDYNLDRLNQEGSERNDSSRYVKPAKYFVAFFTGLIVSVLLGGIVAMISCWLESVFLLIVTIATALIGIIVQMVSNRSGFFSGLISAICGVIAVVVFTYIVESQGYVWDDGTSISENMLIYIIGAALLSGWCGCRDINKN